MLDLADKFKSALSYESFVDSAGKKKDLFRETYQETLLDEKAREALTAFPKKLKFLVIAENWCGDVIAIVPVIKKLTENLPDIELKIISRDAHPELMDAYLTDGKRSVPKMIILNEDFQEIGIWGPRPRTAMNFYRKHTRLLKLGLIGKGIVFEKVRKFYKENRGKEVQAEIARIIRES
ncbi:MAG: thioredoxin family protein [bacterium]